MDPEQTSTRKILAEMLACSTTVAVAAVLMIPAFLNGHIVGHSTYLNLAWNIGFAESLMSGDIYPRWLTNMNGGAGSPVFYFYGPGVFYLSAPFLSLLADPRFALTLAVWWVLGLSGLACYTLLRQYGERGPAMLGAVAYMMLPYHNHTDIWVRAALAEQSAFIWIPLCLLFANRLRVGIRAVVGLAFCYGLLIVSHLPSAVLAAPLIAVMIVFDAINSQRLKVVLAGAGAAFLGMGLSAVYLIPALLTQHYIHPDRWWTEYFSAASWLLFSPEDPPNGGLIGQLEYSLAMLTVTIAATAILLWQDRERRKQLFPWLILTTGAWILMTPLSQPLWENIVVLQKVQFPWRVASFLEVSVCVAVTLLFSRATNGTAIPLRRKIATVSPSIIASAIGAIVYFIPASEIDRASEFKVHEELIAATADASEYLPRWVSADETSTEFSTLGYHDLPNRTVNPEQVLLLGRSSRKMSFIVEVTSSRQVVLPTFYYPSWLAQADSQPIELVPAEATGLATVTLPPGRHLIELARQALPEERIGVIVSGLSLILSVSLLLLSVSPPHLLRSRIDAGAERISQ